MTPTGSTPAERSLQARLAAHALHAEIDDPTAHTAPARQAFLDRFEREVDPEGVLEPKERARRGWPRPQGVFPQAGTLVCGGPQEGPWSERGRVTRDQGFVHLSYVGRGVVVRTRRNRKTSRPFSAPTP